MVALKILAKTKIQAAQDSGTTWYLITKEDILEKSLWGRNIWVQERIKQWPLSQALDLDNLTGSFCFDDEIYLLVTDHKPITLNGIEGREFNPEDVVDEVDNDINYIEGYINDNPDDSIIQRITDSDISWAGLDIDGFAKSLLDIETFEVVAQDAAELGLIDI